MDGEPVCLTDTCVYLGVTMNSKSMWTSWKWFSVELAARFAKNVPHRSTKPPTSVSAMVSELGWEPVQTRRLHGRLNMFYKIARGMVELPLEEYHPVQLPRHQPAAQGHSQ